MIRKFLSGSSIHLRRAFASQFGFLFKDKKTVFITAIVIIALSFIAGWIPDGTQELIWGNKSKGTLMFSTGILALFTLAVVGYVLAKDVEFEVFEDVPQKKKVLLIFLSLPRSKNPEEILAVVKQTEELEDVNRLEAIKSWYMPMKAINHHIPVLEKLVIITSNKSLSYLNPFTLLVKQLFSERISTEHFNADNFESTSHLFELIKDIYGKLNKEGYKDKEIIIDITGGQKTSSIAAALMTIYYNREFQYVSTNDYKVKSYDVILTQPTD